MTRRQIAHYPTRIALDYSKMYGSVFETGPYFLCVCESDIELFVKLMGYARRRVQWAVNLTDSPSFYYGLTDEEWSLLTDKLDDLEGRLMAVVCQQEIVDAINALASCVCEATLLARRESYRLPELTPWIDDGTVTVDTIDETQASPTPPGTDELRCEYAQAVYYQVYEAYSEYLFPYADQASDVILAYLIASTGFAALAGFAGVPVSLLGTIVAYIVDMAIDSSTENFMNWLTANRDELICALYTGLPDFAVAAANVRALVNEQTEISFLDKQLLNVMIGGEWWVRWVIYDQQETGRWDSYLIPGQCDDCEETDPFTWENTVPCVEGDWLTGVPPTCQDGYPTSSPSKGFIRHTAGALTVPATDLNRYSVRIEAVGSSGPVMVSGKWYYPHNGEQQVIFTNVPVNIGETLDIEGTFNTVHIGQVAQLQISNSPWFARVHRYGIAPPE